MAEEVRISDIRKNIPGGLFTLQTNDNFKIILANDYFYKLFGYTREEAEKEGLENLRKVIEPGELERLKEFFAESIREKRDEIDVEFQVTHRNGSILWLLSRGHYDENTKQIKCVLLDITENKKRQELENIAELDKTKKELKNEYYRDSLTGLFNRKGIMESFTSLIEKQKDKLHGFLMIDLDDFKAHNDRSGHPFGDQVLEEVSKGLLSVFRYEDTVGRLGGDEFIVIIADIPNLEVLNQKAQALDKALGRVLENGKPLSISQGIALYPRDGTTFMELYKKADIALYEAKAKGKNQYAHYSQERRDEEIEQKDFASLNLASGKLHAFIKGFMDNAPGGIAMYQKQGDTFATRYVNKGLLEILGLSREEYNQAYKKDGLKILSEESISDWVKVFDGAVSGLEANNKGDVYKLSESIHATPKYLFARVAQVPMEKGAPLLIVLSVDVSDQKKMTEELIEIQQIYRWGLKKTRVDFWEYNLKTKTFINSLGEIFDSIDSLIEAGKIHSDSALAFHRLREEIKGGREEGELFIKGRGLDHSFEWLKVSYRKMRGEMENKGRFFAVADVLPGGIRSQTAYVREEWIKNELVKAGLKVYKTNVTVNKVEMYSSQDMEFEGLGLNNELKTYEDVLSNITENFLRATSVKEFIEKTSRENLVETFHNGEDSTKQFFQMRDEKGKLKWASIYSRIIIHPSSGDYYAYTYIKDDDEKRRRDEGSVEPIRRDPLTNLYDEKIFAKMVDRILKQEKQVKKYGLVVLDMINYNSQKSRLGEQVFDKIFARLAEDFRLFLPSKYICAFKDKGEFIFFLKEEQPASIAELGEKFLEQFKELFRIVDPKDTFLFHGGIASWNKVDSYQTLYQKALTARNTVETGKNWDYAIFEEIEAGRKASLLLSKEAVTFSSNKLDVKKEKKILFNEDKDLVKSTLLCSIEFIESQEFETALFQSCESLADYYLAERIFLIEAEEDSLKKTCYLQWQRGSATFLQDQALPEADIYSDTFSEAYKRREGFITKNIMAVPFLIDEAFGGFVGIVNPRSNQDDLRLINTIAYIMGAELYRLRLRERKEYCSIYDLDTDFYNRNEYNNVLERLETESLSSLGVMMIELNEVEDKNTLQVMKGFDKKVIQVAKRIRGVCKDCEIFRAAEGEFIMLYRDSTLEHFMATSLRLQDEIDQHFPGDVSLGYCWSGEDIEINRLLRHAEELKVIDRFRKREGSSGNQGENREEALEKLLEDIRDNRFSVSIQPIIVAETGEIRGGEALIRRIDENGFLCLPLEFIRNYEAWGIIRYIDLFVLEEVCKTISQWIKRRALNIPISVNFSRQTLLESDIIPKIIEISEKYNVPRELIDIEVTERLGDAEESTIMGIATSIRESGFGLSLDDFGTEYSNLSFVARLNVDTLKIDRSLISQIHESKTIEAIVRSVLRLCKELKIYSVAEGVETKDQVNTLKAWGCDYLQGFYYSKALPIEDFERIYLNHSIL